MASLHTIGSLFSGIGGLELGLEHATGARTVWNCEMDEFCRKVLAKHWPDAKQYLDVHEIDDEVERVDIICGGFPCQNLSVAGDRTGLSGEKSGLWHEYARIVRLLRPRFVFVENVPSLRTFVSDDGLGRVLGDLAESGYDAEWDCVPAAAVGAPHVRDRIFVLAWLREMADSDGETRGPQTWVPEREGGPGEDGRGTPKPRRRGGLVPVADAESGGRGSRRRGRMGTESGATQGHASRQASAAPGAVGDTDGTGRKERRRSGAVRAQQPAPERAGGPLLRGIAADFPPSPGSDRWAEWLAAHPDAQPAIRRDPDGVPGGVDPDRRKRLKALGNAVVPQAAARAWRLLIDRAGVAL